MRRESGGRSMFQSRAEAPSLGLKLTVFTGSQAQGLPLPPAVSIKVNNIIRDAYYGNDLWKRNQFVARWKSPDGNMIEVAVPLSLPPEENLKRLFTPEDYSTWEGKNAAQVKGDVALGEWFMRLSDAEMMGSPQIVTGAFTQLQRVRRIMFSSEDPMVAYELIFRSRPDLPIILIARAARGRAADLATAMERDVLLKMTMDRPPARPPMPPGDTMLEQSKMKAIRLIEGRKGWWYAASTHYVVLTDLRPTRKKWLIDVLQNVEQIRSAYEKIMPPIQPIMEVGVISIYCSRVDYIEYVGEEHENSGGLWDPEKRQLVICALESDNATQREQREWITRTLYHEAMHQYLFYALPQVALPIWFNEAHATFAEGAELKKAGWEIGETERYVSMIEAWVRSGRVDFGSILKMTQSEFYSENKGLDEVRLRYAKAWALAYFLHKGVPSGSGQSLAGVLGEYRLALASADSSLDATEQVFTDQRVQAINTAFCEFWKSPNRRSAARRYDPLIAQKPHVPPQG